MLDNIRQQYIRLVSAYESERAERLKLEEENRRLSEQCKTREEKITELEKKIDNLKLANAFSGANERTPEAKKKIEALVKEIDRCIGLMEG